MRSLGGAKWRAQLSQPKRAQAGGDGERQAKEVEQKAKFDLLRRKFRRECLRPEPSRPDALLAIVPPRSDQ